MSRLLSFRPRNTRTIEFFMLALREALRARGAPLDIPVAVINDAWKRDDQVVVFEFLADGKTIRFQLEEPGAKEALP